jgi:hypothetical protein
MAADEKPTSDIRRFVNRFQRSGGFSVIGNDV